MVGDDKAYKVPKTLNGVRPPRDPVKLAEWKSKMEKHVAEQLRKRAGKTNEEKATESTSKEIEAKPEPTTKSKKQASSGIGATKKVKSKVGASSGTGAKNEESKVGQKKLSAWTLFVKERMPTMSGKDTKDNMRKIAAMWKQEKESFTAAVAKKLSAD